MTDPFDDPDAKAWAEQVARDLVPRIQASEMTVSLVPAAEATDVKFAVELGFSVMLDKPIIAVIAPGAVVPEKLARVADRIIEGPIEDPSFQQRLYAAIDDLIP